jgi:hypothetical protein
MLVGMQCRVHTGRLDIHFSLQNMASCLFFFFSEFPADCLLFSVHLVISAVSAVDGTLPPGLL